MQLPDLRKHGAGDESRTRATNLGDRPGPHRGVVRSTSPPSSDVRAPPGSRNGTRKATVRTCSTTRVLAICGGSTTSCCGLAVVAGTYWAVKPPSTTMLCPVTNEARSEQSHTTASAISYGRPRRRMGVPATNEASVSGLAATSRSIMGVWMTPGRTAFTRIPTGANASRRLQVSDRAISAQRLRSHKHPARPGVARAQRST